MRKNTISSSFSLHYQFWHRLCNLLIPHQKSDIWFCEIWWHRAMFMHQLCWSRLALQRILNLICMQIATPNPWKAGQSSGSNESSGRKVNENKLLSSKKNRFNPYTTSGEFNKCRICRTKVHQVGAHYCQDCAYKKGICAMCGTKILKTKNYKQSSV